jgi:hypothetical protein
MPRTSSPPRAARRALRLIVAAVTLGGMVLAVPAFLSAASAASAATETPLRQAGWVATSNTNSSSGAGGWTGDQSAAGLVVNGSNVETTGLAVEHFQQYETIWNGQGGTDIFFQHVNPCEVPSQGVWMSSATQDGYPA